MIDVSKIRINYINAESYDKDDPTFQKHLKALYEELSAPKAIEAACAHEAGHLTYFRSLGATLNYSPDEFKLVCPYVRYRFNRKKLRYEFDHAIASTETPFDEDTITYSDETLFRLAKACFAGGIFVKEFVEGASRGDADDSDKFHDYYVAAIRRSGIPDKLESQLTLEAVKAVLADLQNAEARKEAQLLAYECEVEFLAKTDSASVL